MIWLEIPGTPRWLCKINGSEVSRCEEIGIEKEETHVGGPVYIRKLQNNPLNWSKPPLQSSTFHYSQNKAGQKNQLYTWNMLGCGRSWLCFCLKNALLPCQTWIRALFFQVIACRCHVKQTTKYSNCKQLSLNQFQGAKRHGKIVSLFHRKWKFRVIFLYFKIVLILEPDEWCEMKLFFSVFIRCITVTVLLMMIF